MKAIAYSLFGFNKAKYENCFTFDSYLSGLMLSIRFNRLVYPDWITVLETDTSTYTAYAPLFSYLSDRNILRIEKNGNDSALCEAMLWRLKPIYWKDGSERWEFSHVLCRDLDSLSTYREAQAVQVWMNHDKAMHAITDSVSHDIALMGGMIGVRPDYFSARTNTNSYEELRKKFTGDLSCKGSDQLFLNSIVYPCFSEKGTDSITQHYFKGHARTWLSDFHSCRCWENECRVGHKAGCPEDVSLNIPIELKETNEISEHIGASGWNQQQTMRLVEKYKDKFHDLIYIEKQYPQIFYWVK